MAEIDYLSKTGLTKVWEKISGTFVRKERKTGSDSEWKVLSDNNLTDELKQKILDAGTGSFTGVYNDLVSKPSIEGHELKGGNQTAESLGLATPANITTATADMATQTWVQGLGYQTETNVTDKITAATTDMATKTWVQSEGYQKAADVQSAVTSATAGMATQTWVEGKGYQTSTEVSAAIADAVGSMYTAKGSTAFASLPALGSVEVGDVYNVTDAFTTTADFIEGEGKSYPAGTNVVCVSDSGTKKWDALGAMVDLSGYVLASDLVPIDEGYINTNLV